MGLRHIEEEFGDQVAISWRAYPLTPDERPGRHFSEHARESWAAAEAATEGAQFIPWEPEAELPASSIPALAASKCALRQGEEPFGRYHLALLRAYFTEQRDIADWNVLLALAQESGLDLERLVQDLSAGDAIAEVVGDWKEAQETYGVDKIPTVFFSDGKGSVRVVGASPIDQYRRLVRWFLST